MGYDSQLVVFKKRVIKEAKKKSPASTITDLFTERLFIKLLPEELEEQVRQPEEKRDARYVYTGSCRFFKQFFEEHGIEIGNGEVVELSKEAYEDIYNGLKNELQSLTLWDVAGELDNYRILTNAAHDLKEAKIDFETETVLFEHDW